jgi:hypothetical protein
MAFMRVVVVSRNGFAGALSAGITPGHDASDGAVPGDPQMSRGNWNTH